MKPFHPMMVDNVLTDEQALEVRRVGRKAHFQPVPKGNGTFLHLAAVPRFLDNHLHHKTEVHLDLRSGLRNIASFYRLNTRQHDTEFRVHCDRLIQGEQPDVACVYYLESSEVSGTAFFRHPEHGVGDPENLKVFDVDDGKWEPYNWFYARANSMLIYPTSLYHGRFPWVAEGSDKSDGRIVVVKFLKVKQ
jgi:hypothetical protein